MRVLLLAILPGALALTGCVRKSEKAPPAPPTAPYAGTPAAPAEPAFQNPALIVTPDVIPAGKVALVNATARHVVLTFPLHKMPSLGQRLALYRRGSQVGEVKVTGPQREDNIVADLVAGEADVGDEVRSQ